MKSEYLTFLCCPSCNSDLKIETKFTEIDRIKEGKLNCSSCKKGYEIRNFIPRFIEKEAYADSFGAQWNAFAKVQLDGKQTSESSLRFDSEIGWDEKNFQASQLSK